MISKDKAYQALQAMLQELPMEFSIHDGPHFERCRESFTVAKRRNVMTVWTALDTLQKYFESDPHYSRRTREDNNESP